MSLRNRTILVTRPREQAGEMVLEIEGRGGIAVVVPVVTISSPLSWKECDEALRRLADYDAVAFTSVNAVERFYERAHLLGVSRESVTAVPALAVGTKTAAAIRTFGARVEIVPEQFTGASLADSLGSAYAGKRVLVPRGNIAREEFVEGLRRSGAHADTVTVYMTRTPEGLAAGGLGRRVLTGEFDVAAFASPSAADNFASLFTALERGSIPQHIRIAAIGPTTADALRGHGLAVDILARESTGRNLIECIDEYFC